MAEFINLKHINIVVKAIKHMSIKVIKHIKFKVIHIKQKVIELLFKEVNRLMNMFKQVIIHILLKVKYIIIEHIKLKVVNIKLVILRHNTIRECIMLQVGNIKLLVRNIKLLVRNIKLFIACIMELIRHKKVVPFLIIHIMYIGRLVKHKFRVTHRLFMVTHNLYSLFSMDLFMLVTHMLVGSLCFKAINSLYN